MGFTCALSPLGTLNYRAEVGGNLIEHELVHVFAGSYDGQVHPDPQEADDIAWRSLGEIRRNVGAAPETYTAWFRKYLDCGWPFGPIPDTTNQHSA